jgi:anti-sigma-K factor RskA
MRYHNSELGDLLAAEYVLGTLRGPARRRFEKLLSGYPSLRQRVQEWDLRLNRLAQSAPPVAPPAAAFDALQQRLFPGPPRPQWFERLNLWRGLAVGSSVLAGVLAAVLLVTPPQQTPGYVVMISSMETHQPAWLINASHDLDQLYVKSLKVLDMPQDIRCILWLRPEGSEQIYALGVLPDKGDDMMLDVARDKRTMMPGQLLVTLEDMSGAMPQQPSTPPVYEGRWMPLKI